jgi:transposase-like protein
MIPLERIREGRWSMKKETLERMCHGKQVADFRTRPLDEEYPFLWIDALYQRIRVEGRVVSVAVMIACGVTRQGSARSWP